MENMNLSAIRTIRVLRPLRAINRIPSKCTFSCYRRLPTNKKREIRFLGGLSDHFFLFFFYSSFTFQRYENPRHAPAGHAAHAWQRLVAVFFRLFHLWDRWRPAVGRHPTPKMLPRSAQGHRPASYLVSCPTLLHSN